jgi:hypothetical protein
VHRDRGRAVAREGALQTSLSFKAFNVCSWSQGERQRAAPVDESISPYRRKLFSPFRDLFSSMRQLSGPCRDPLSSSRDFARRIPRVFCPIRGRHRSFTELLPSLTVHLSPSCHLLGSSRQLFFVSRRLDHRSRRRHQSTRGLFGPVRPHDRWTRLFFRLFTRSPGPVRHLFRKSRRNVSAARSAFP